MDQYYKGLKIYTEGKSYYIVLVDGSLIVSPTLRDLKIRIDQLESEIEKIKNV